MAFPGGPPAAGIHLDQPKHVGLKVVDQIEDLAEMDRTGPQVTVDGQQSSCLAAGAAGAVSDVVNQQTHPEKFLYFASTRSARSTFPNGALT
ncbi:hypothetical protein SDC9_191072 [bioreactor metagenome]|uniref:Uncharacterized protein n=1 Tax=bioreactor metagenome TaxID=1076179 RepID=A0A645HYE0_9ZZZZ